MYIAAGCVLCIFFQKMCICSICKTDWPIIPYLLFIRIKKVSFGLEPETGLSRYDGRRITNFEISSSYPSISNLKEAFDGVLAFVDNGVFSAFDLKKERFLSVVSSSGQGIPSRGMLQKNDSLVWVISGSELHLMKRCASKEGELRLRVEEKYTGWDNQDNLLVAITYSSDKKTYLPD